MRLFLKRRTLCLLTEGICQFEQGNMFLLTMKIFFYLSTYFFHFCSPYTSFWKDYNKRTSFSKGVTGMFRTGPSVSMLMSMRFILICYSNTTTTTTTALLQILLQNERQNCVSLSVTSCSVAFCNKFFALC